MKLIARARIPILGYLVRILFLLAGANILHAEVTLPDFNQYNRGIMQGAKVNHGVRYNDQPSNTLEKGKHPPGSDSWGDHSCLTTSLFKISKGKYTFDFMMRSDGGQKERSVLRVLVRYYNKNGLLIHSTGGRNYSVPQIWTAGSYQLTPEASDIAYAEVWMIKYQDALPAGDKDHAIYIADLKLQ